MPKITSCLIVSQRKAIVCPREAPQSQGLSADSFIRQNPSKTTVPQEHAAITWMCFTFRYELVLRLVHASLKYFSEAKPHFSSLVVFTVTELTRALTVFL